MRFYAPFSRIPAAAFLAAAALLPAACGSGGESIGEFKVLATNVSDGDTWALNRPIVLYFNNSIDPTSVSFSSVQIRATSPISQGSPVTGSFELIPDQKGNPDFGLRFLPACPTDPQNSNGAFRPGQVPYEIVLPTRGEGGTSTLRDTQGRSLGVGLTRTFRTPSSAEPLFADTGIGPPQFVSVEYPAGLGLYSAENSPMVVRLDQPYSAQPSNLSLDRIFVQYANTTGNFPLLGNRVPGKWLAIDNCNQVSTLYFQPSGVLLPGRALRVVMTTDFLDLGGNGNSSPLYSDAGQLPTLAEYYGAGGGPAFTEADTTVDEVREEYLTSAGLDFEASLPQPTASYSLGAIRANFEYPGPTNLDPDDDFRLTTSQGYIEINTSTATSVTDGLGRVFPIESGVLAVNDFTIEAGATLRIVGDLPFILYTTGQVRILGTLDASGFHGTTPTGTFRPDLAVPGGVGVAGGGQGGDASLVLDNYTPRGENGDGPFGQALAGGRGGEGGFQQSNSVDTNIDYLMVGGGGGGGFSLGVNDAVFFTGWQGATNPATHDNGGSDLRTTRHTVWTNGGRDPEEAFLGAEAGMRGSARDSQITGDPPHGVHGFEDQLEDAVIDSQHDLAWDREINDYDPLTGLYKIANDWGTDNTFDFGNPTFGPDGGAPGVSPFIDGDKSNDFWGQRYFWDGIEPAPVLVTGELLAPWAGSGGGASGDCQTVLRQDLDGDMLLDPLTDFFPDQAFPTGSTQHYWRGASGGGGGGQMQILAIGPITIGPAALIRANGGIGAGGESTGEAAGLGRVTQISGSGGGSGGHIVLHSATGLNLSQITVGTAGDPGDPQNFFNLLQRKSLVQAIGGRRGWAGSSRPAANPTSELDFLNGAENGFDGNSDFMVGRGGAGASGVIQVHVPDPATSILFHPSVNDKFRQFMTMEDPGNPAVSDRVDQLLGLYGLPQPWALVPMFSTKSQIQSKWIDTGLADLRNPANGTGPFPDYSGASLAFAGIDPATGLVQAANSLVVPGTVVAAGGGGASAFFSAYSVVISDPSAVFDASFLQNPALLIGYDVIPSASQLPAPGFQIVDVEYQAAPERLTLHTRVVDGVMSTTAGTDWQVRQRFLRIDTTTIKDRIPATATVRVQFQGTEEEAPLGSGVPDPLQATPWTGDGTTTLADLKGYRFLRYRITFDIDALGSGAALGAEKPALDYLKIPFVW